MVSASIGQFQPHADTGRRCIHCRWIEVEVIHRTGRRSLTCGNPQCLRGQASEQRPCCMWEREPGADDDAAPPSG